jgi:hypothetical protein
MRITTKVQQHNRYSTSRYSSARIQSATLRREPMGNSPMAVPLAVVAILATFFILVAIFAG